MLPGVLRQLNSREGQPFRQGPYVVRQTGLPRRGAWLPAVVVPPDPERANRPAEGIGVPGEIGRGIRGVPVFGKTIALTRLAGVAVPVGGVVPLEKGGIDRVLTVERSRAAWTASGSPKTTRRSISRPPVLGDGSCGPWRSSGPAAAPGRPRVAVPVGRCGAGPPFPRRRSESPCHQRRLMARAAPVKCSFRRAGCGRR